MTISLDYRRPCVTRYRGAGTSEVILVPGSFLCMAFAQLTSERLRAIEYACVLHQSTAYNSGIRSGRGSQPRVALPCHERLAHSYADFCLPSACSASPGVYSLEPSTSISKKQLRARRHTIESGSVGISVGRVPTRPRQPSSNYAGSI